MSPTPAINMRPLQKSAPLCSRNESANAPHQPIELLSRLQYSLWQTITMYTPRRIAPTSITTAIRNCKIVANGFVMFPTNAMKASTATVYRCCWREISSFCLLFVSSLKVVLFDQGFCPPESVSSRLYSRNAMYAESRAESKPSVGNSSLPPAAQKTPECNCANREF